MKALRGFPKPQHAPAKSTTRLMSTTSSLIKHHEGRYRHVLPTSTRLQTQHRPQPLLYPTSTTLHNHHRRTYASTSFAHTPLYDLHLAHAGKMVPFGGYAMPVQYGDHSIAASHLFTRSHASLFDVSHMVQHSLSGPGAAAFLASVTPSAPSSLALNTSTLSCFLLPTGGIVDDSIITRLADAEFYFVTNAARRDADLAFLQRSIDDFRSSGGAEIEHKVLSDYALVALQGPLAAELLRPHVGLSPAAMDALLFGQCASLTFTDAADGRKFTVLVSRGGYTGEDGFEISVPASDATALVETLLSAGPEKVRLAGLGARDTLRLEAGMCLYGHDISEETTPVEAGLGWCVSKERRESGGFNGSEVILPQLVPRSKGGKGVQRRRVGLMMAEGTPPAREGATIEDEGQELGTVTSGAPSPSLGRNIAMGYVRDGWHKSGAEIEVVVRERKHKAVVTKMPFVPSKYWKGGVAPG